MTKIIIIKNTATNNFKLIWSNACFRLRIVELSCHKVLQGPDPELTLDQVTISPPRLYRIEEIPRDEVNLQASFYFV